MKKILLLFFLLFSFSFAYQSSIKKIIAVGIFDSSGKGENVQHLKRTKGDYNGICYTKVFLYGNAFNVKPEVSIGNSIGHFVNTKPIYDKNNIKIGEELLYKHFNVKNGLIRITIRNRVYDSKVYVK